MVKRGILVFMAVLGLALVAAKPARAQFGSLEGDVKDRDGKPLVGALVVIDRVDIKGNYKVKTDKKGHYFHGGLPLGQYNVTLMQGEQVLDRANNVRVRLGEPTPINFDLKQAQERAMAAQAGIQLQSKPGGSGEVQLTKEQRAQIEGQQKQRQAQQEKMEKLNKSFAAGSEALRAAGSTPVLIAQAGLQLQPGQPLTNEQQTQIDALRVKYYETAVTELETAVQADPNQHVVLAHLGEAYVGAGRAKRGEEATALYKKAIEIYQKAIALKADEASYHNNYGLALIAAGQLEEAKAEFTKAAQLDPPAAGRYYFNLGAVLTNSGKIKEAAEAFRLATQADPNYAEAWYQLGIALSGEATLDEKTGKITAAPGTIEALNKYIEIAPNGPNVEAAKSLAATLGGTVQMEIKAAKPARKR